MLEVNDFHRLIDWITENFQVIRMEDLDRHLISGDRKRPPIVLTFDDGLASVIDLALPILQEHRISAVLFVTTDWIDSGRTPDIFLLEKAIWECLPVKLVILIGDKKLELRINSRQEASKAFTRLWYFLFKIRFPPLKLNAEDIHINGKRWERQKSEDRYFWFPASWEEIRAAF